MANCFLENGMSVVGVIDMGHKECRVGCRESRKVGEKGRGGGLVQSVIVVQIQEKRTWAASVVPSPVAPFFLLFLQIDM